MRRATVYRTRENGRFTHESVECALDIHQASGLIKRWERDPRTHGPSGTRNIPLYTVVTSTGDPLDLATVWEAHAFVYGLSSARHAMEKEAQHGSRPEPGVHRAAGPQAVAHPAQITG